MQPTTITTVSQGSADPVAARYWRYRIAVIAAAGGFAVFLLGAIGLSSWQSRERTLQQAEMEARNLSLALSELMARSIESVDILLRSLRDAALDSELHDAAAMRNLSAVSRERILGLPPIRALVVFDWEGHMVALSRGHPPPKVNVADRDYFIALRDQKRDALFIGVPTINRVNQEWTINVARRITGPDGAFQGVVLATLEPLYYEQVYAAINLVSGGVIAMFREDGVLLARHPRSEEFMGKSVGDTPFRRVLAQTNDTGTMRGPGGIDGLPRIIAGRFLRGYPIYVTVSQREDVVLADWRYDTLIAAGVVVAVLVALGALTVLLLQQLRHREASERAILAAREEAENASRAKSAFLANMSHELRTPLNAIIGFAEVLDSQVVGPMANSKQHEYIRDIRASGEHLRDLVSDILDLAKIEAEKWELNREVLDPVAECQGVAAIMRGLALHKGVKIRVADSAEPLTVYADRLVLRQMLINLVGNAIKFTPAGGVVAMACRREGEASAILVTDTGVGIRAEDLARVLEPFEQGDSNLPRPGKDSGLGLALTKAFAELHDGVLGIASEPGAGTTITLRLPAAVPA